VKAVLPLIEEHLAPFDARPHWAKLFTMSPARLEAQYARLNDFKQLLNQYDPKAKFRNDFLSTNLYS
jgi:xylitol oxidase